MSKEGVEITRAGERLGLFVGGENPTGQPIPRKIVAACLRCSEATVSRYLDGSVVPTWPQRWIIQSWTGGYVEDRDWCSPEERDLINLAHELRPYGTPPKKARKGKAKR